MKLLANIKESKVLATIGATFMALAVCLGLMPVQAAPANAATAICCAAEFKVVGGDPSLVMVELKNFALEPATVSVVLTTSLAGGSGQQVIDTVTLQPATENPVTDMGNPQPERIPSLATFGPFSVPHDSRLGVVTSGVQFAFYDNNTAPTNQQAIPGSVSFANCQVIIDLRPPAPGLSAPVGFNYAINGEVVALVPASVNTFDVQGQATVTASLQAGFLQGRPVGPWSSPANWVTACAPEEPEPPADDTATKLVPTCHLEGNGAYTASSPSVNAWYAAGHLNHEGDIWASFTYVKQGQTITVPAQGDQAILANGCNPVAVTPDPEPQPQPDPEPQPNPNPAPGGDPAPQQNSNSNQNPAPSGDPAPQQNQNLTPSGNTASQVQNTVQSGTTATDDSDTLRLTADTAAGDSGSDYTVSVLLGSAGLILLFAAFARRRQLSVTE